MMKRTILAMTALVMSLAAAPGLAGRSAIDDARAQLMRLHTRLYAEAASAPEVLEAQRAAGAAYTEMHRCRQDVLLRLYQTDAYKDLRLALYHTQRRLAGNREEIPVRVQRIMQSATDALAVRVQITRLESEALEADATYVEARDLATALNAAYRQTLRDSLASIKANPEFVALCDQIAGIQQSITGVRSVARFR
jgi:hypothetical protein